jgi:hypothetical protein
MGDLVPCEELTATNRPDADEARVLSTGRNSTSAFLNLFA